MPPIARATLSRFAAATRYRPPPGEPAFRRFDAAIAAYAMLAAVHIREPPCRALTRQRRC